MTNKQPFEYYLNLIRNGEVLTNIENSNAKELLRQGCNKDLETCLAVVLRNRYESGDWNDWFYNRFSRFSRTPDEEVNDD